jgi:hypothetical protein
VYQTPPRKLDEQLVGTGSPASVAYAVLTVYVVPGVIATAALQRSLVGGGMLAVICRVPPVMIGRVHALEGGGTKSGWQAANRGVGQDLDASV